MYIFPSVLDFPVTCSSFVKRERSGRLKRFSRASASWAFRTLRDGDGLLASRLFMVQPVVQGDGVGRCAACGGRAQVGLKAASVFCFEIARVLAQGLRRLCRSW